MQKQYVISSAPVQSGIMAGGYVAPCTTRAGVQTEGVLCESQDAEIKLEKKTIEVEEWATIENDITFE